jgi:hypothetical protein
MISNLSKLSLSRTQLLEKMSSLVTKREEIVCFRKYRVEQFADKIPKDQAKVQVGRCRFSSLLRNLLPIPMITGEPKSMMAINSIPIKFYHDTPFSTTHRMFYGSACATNHFSTH